MLRFKNLKQKQPTPAITANNMNTMMILPNLPIFLKLNLRALMFSFWILSTNQCMSTKLPLWVVVSSESLALGFSCVYMVQRSACPPLRYYSNGLIVFKLSPNLSFRDSSSFQGSTGSYRNLTISSLIQSPKLYSLGCQGCPLKQREGSQRIKSLLEVIPTWVMLKIGRPEFSSVLNALVKNWRHLMKKSIYKASWQSNLIWRSEVRGMMLEGDRTRQVFYWKLRSRGVNCSLGSSDPY